MLITNIYILLKKMSYKENTTKHEVKGHRNQYKKVRGIWSWLYSKFQKFIADYIYIYIPYISQKCHWKISAIWGQSNKNLNKL